MCRSAGSCTVAAAGAGDEGRNDVGGVAVEGLTGPVLSAVVRGSAGDAASCTSRSGTSASRAAVMKLAEALRAIRLVMPAAAGWTLLDTSVGTRQSACIGTVDHCHSDASRGLLLRIDRLSRGGQGRPEAGETTPGLWVELIVLAGTFLYFHVTFDKD